MMRGPLNRGPLKVPMSMKTGPSQAGDRTSLAAADPASSLAAYWRTTFTKARCALFGHGQLSTNQHGATGPYLGSFELQKDVSRLQEAAVLGFETLALRDVVLRTREN